MSKTQFVDHFRVLITAMQKHLIKSIFLICIVSMNNFSLAQTANDADLSKNAPTDIPHNVNGAEQLTKYDELINPYVQKAQTSLPDAKKRYLNGLEDGQAFFLTTRIYDVDGNYEQIFVRVKKWEDSIINGTIANEINVVKNFSLGQPIQFPETAVLDWLITNPDGSEEGNYVGKFLDSLNSHNDTRLKRYEMKGHSISIALPDEWILRSLSGGAAYKAELQCENNSFCDNIMFAFIGNPSNSSVDEFANALTAQLPKQFKKYDLLSVSDTTVSNTDYKVIDYSVVQPEGKYNCTSLLKCYKDRTVVINYTSKAVKKRDYKTNRDMFFSFIETIEIE